MHKSTVFMFGQTLWKTLKSVLGKFREKHGVRCTLKALRQFKKNRHQDLSTVVLMLRRLLDQALVTSVSLKRHQRVAVQRHTCKKIDKNSLQIRTKKKGRLLSKLPS